MPETLFTVWVNLFERGFAADGDTVLVHGGTSGIGTMAIKLGKLFGLEVIVTCGIGREMRRARSSSARRTRSTTGPGFRRGGASADRAARASRWCSTWSAATMSPRNLACLADDGRHVSIAFQRGATAEIPIVDIMRRRLTLTGSTLRAARHRVQDDGRATRSPQTVWPYVEGNRLKPVMDQSFPAGRGRRRPCADGGGRPCRQDRARRSAA